MNMAFKPPVTTSRTLDSIAEALLLLSGIDGVYARTASFEQVVDGLTDLISQYREPKTEVLRFPPVMSRRQVEKSGYLKSFPHFLGCVSCLAGEELEIFARRSTATRPARIGRRRWRRPISCLAPPLAIRSIRSLPAAARCRQRACSSTSLATASGANRQICSTGCSRFACANTSASARLPDRGLSRRWMSLAEGFAARLGLSWRIDHANDPFFGRGGKLMAASQVEQALKFELLIPVQSAEQPTACMSFNYHRDHFGTTWNIRNEAGEVAHTGCVAFGIDRLALALFATHGLELPRWPASARKALTI